MNPTAEVEYTYADARVGTVRPEGAIFPSEERFPFDCGANEGMADALARVAAYGYDRLNRLIAFQRGELNATKDGITGTPVKAEEWGLDTTGNWDAFLQKISGTTDLDQARTHNPVNEITAITATTGTNWADPEHDRNGNMTTIPKPASLADGLNRRIKSHTDSGAPSNPTGIDTYVHYYYNSAGQILETRQTDTPSAQPETLQPKQQHVWSQRYIDSAVLRDEDTGANGLCDDQRLYYLNDANFNVTALLDTNGHAVERYVYSPYGVLTIYDATWTNPRSTSTHANVTLYTGRELDTETGLYYYRNRYYGAQLGRFVSRDPIGNRAGVNVYAYVVDSPTARTDANGLWGYGHYCGPFHFGQGGEPIDALDEACERHDECLATWREFLILCRRRYCDLVLCVRATAAMAWGCSSSPTPWRCRIAAKSIADIMCSVGTAPLPFPF